MPIDRNGGQYITANPQQPTQSSAPGIWDIDEQGSAQAAGRWPLPPNVVQRSLRFNSADSAYLNRTPTVAGNRRTYTLSLWVKRSGLGTEQHFLSVTAATNVNGWLTTRFTPADKLYIDTWGINLSTDAVFRDTSAWYHVVFAVDTTQTTDTNRWKIYVNGTQQTVTGSYPTLNLETAINSTNVHNISRYPYESNYFFNGYMAEINFVDGQALTPSSFGQTDAQTGQWIPRVYSGSYGTNGFRLQFLDNSGTTATTLGKDTSGMGNNWTPNNFSVAAGSGNDSLRDVPMNYYSPDNGLGGEVIGNYCTLNPLDNGGITLSNGNLDATRSTATTAATRCTFAVSSGKWYWEVTPTALGALTVGIGTQSASLSGIVGGDAFGYGWYNDSGGTSSKYNSNVSSSYGTALSAGVTCGVALDLDAGTITFYRNGVSQGVAYSGITAGTYFPMISQWGGTTSTANLNFGQRPFAYTAPSGFKALCTQNLSAPRIGNVAATQANDYFNTVLYNGTGATQSITGVGFQPDLVWVKNRTGTQWHNLTDAVRGTNSQLYSNDVATQGTLTNALTSFDSDGFTVGSAGDWNGSGYSMVGWCWNAGGSTVTNTSGTITSSVRANQTSGFSVVTYTGNTTGGATVGHGLGAAPSMIILKSRTSGGGWAVYHTSLGPTQYIWLMQTTGAATYSGAWNNTAPTSSVFTLGSDGQWNGAFNFVAYCFAAVPGFSSFGSFSGTGSTDGAFVYTGFRPAFVMVKTSLNSTDNWYIDDVKRDTYNMAGLSLMPNLPNAQATSVGAAYSFRMDILSNGFKIRESYGTTVSFIYAAFAETPFQFANAR